jgi:hypothetical protein
MMKALLIIKGWERIKEINPVLINYGSIEVALEPPIDLLISPRDKIKELGATRVSLRYTGHIDRNGEIPVFEYI